MTSFSSPADILGTEISEKVTNILVQEITNPRFSQEFKRQVQLMGNLYTLDMYSEVLNIEPASFYDGLNTEMPKKRE